MDSTTVTAAEGLVHAGKNHLSWGKQLCAQVGFMAAFAPDKENEWERIRVPPYTFESSVTLRPSLRSSPPLHLLDSQFSFSLPVYRTSFRNPPGYSDGVGVRFCVAYI